jgi:hypothetical protein
MCYIFIFLKLQEVFYFLSYFFYDPLITEQCGVQPPIAYIFTAAALVVDGG